CMRCSCFFHAEDGIRDRNVTGVQTCALPISISYWSALIRGSAMKNGHNPDVAEAFMNKDKEIKIGDRVVHPKGAVLTLNAQEARSEERRVGKESSTGRSPNPQKSEDGHGNRM